MTQLTTRFRRNLKLMKWLIPLGLIVIVIIYEVGPSRWINEWFGFEIHILAEILLFGTLGPLLVIVLLELLGRWIDERETADLQAHLLAESKKRDMEIRQLNDDVLQVLFAASLLLTTIKSDEVNLPPGRNTQIENTEQALNDSIEHLRSHMLM